MAEELKCKHCGKRFYAAAHCQHSPSKKHVAMTDGKNCVHCGHKFMAGVYCLNSPTKKHQLEG